MQVLGFMELPEEDVPDELIWHHPQRLEEHFEAVKQRRANPTGPRASEPMETVPMMSNALTEGIER